MSHETFENNPENNNDPEKFVHPNIMTLRKWVEIPIVNLWIMKRMKPVFDNTFSYGNWGGVGWGVKTMLT